MPTKTPSSDTLPLHGSPRLRTVDDFHLTVVEGPNKGKTVRSGGAEVGVGTAPGNRLCLDDPSVSRHHFSVTASPRGFLLRDLGSTNGTRVNGCRVELGLLEGEGVVEAGRTKLAFKPHALPVVEPLSPEDRFGKLLGRSEPLRRIFAMLPTLAASPSTLLIQGETGTGKGALAESIHQAGPRSSGPFVVLDCASIPASLVESELFGHVRGSFTSAHADHEGAFEQARGGTIFLDEIGELPLDIQPKLLRALEDRTVKRVGGKAPISLDVRVVAATNRDLRSEVNRGTFRSDLYYRLDVLKVELPPLRDRPGDVPLLAEFFYERVRPGKKPPPGLAESLGRQRWPGNVRELRSAVERWILLDDLGGDAHAPPPAEAPSDGLVKGLLVDFSVPFRLAKERATSQWEHAYLEALMERTGGNLSQAARLVDTDRSHLRELLRRHGIRVAGSG